MYVRMDMEDLIKDAINYASREELNSESVKETKAYIWRLRKAFLKRCENAFDTTEQEDEKLQIISSFLAAIEESLSY